MSLYQLNFLTYDQLNAQPCKTLGGLPFPTPIAALFKREYYLFGVVMMHPLNSSDVVDFFSRCSRVTRARRDDTTVSCAVEFFEISGFRRHSLFAFT